MKTLHLTLKKKWFDMIASGVKKEEYRDLKKYWSGRLLDKIMCDESGGYLYNIDGDYTKAKYFDTIAFKNGYSKNAPTMVVEFKGIEIGKARPEWSDNWEGEVFIIKLGEILNTNI